MLKALLKFLVSLGTIFVVLFAILLVLARIGSAFAPNFEGALNQRFADQEFEFSDLSIRWRGINPVIEFDEVASANLRAEEVIAELNTLASFWRNTYVFRTIQVKHVSITLKQNSACTLTLPNDADSSLGIGSILRHADNVDLSFSSSIECGSVHHEYEGFYRTIRLDNVYRVHASIRDLNACDTCYISLLYETNTTGFWRREEERILNVQAHDFVVPTSLLGWEFMEDSVMNAQILMNGTSQHAALVGDVDFHPNGQSDSSDKLSLELRSTLEKSGFSGKIKANLFDENNDVVGSLEHFIKQDIGLGHFHGWSYDVPVEIVNTFFAIFGVAGHPMAERLTGHNPSGNVTTIQWLYDQSGFTYRATIDEFHIHQYASFPSLIFDATIVVGRGPIVQVEGGIQQVHIGEAEYIFSPLSLSGVNFSSLAFWRRGKIDCYFDGRWEPLSDLQSVEFEIGYQKDYLAQRQSFRFALEIPRASASHVRPYLASFVPATAFTWIEQSVLQAQFDHMYVELARIADQKNPASSVNVELAVPFTDAEVIFDKNWPKIVQGSGLLWLDEDELVIEVDSAYSHGNHIEQGKISLPFSEPVLDMEFTADMTFSLLQSYLIDSPLTNEIEFDLLQIVGNGPIDLAASILIPLRDEYESSWNVEMDVILSDVSLEMRSSNLQLDDINGSLNYRYPNQFSSSQLTGNFFESPVNLEVITRTETSDSFEVAIAFQLDTSIHTISNLTGDWLRTIAQGSTHTSGEVIFPFSDKSPPTLEISTNLVGVELLLPVPFYKEADDDRRMQMLITLAESITIDVEMDELIVKAMISEGGALRGSVGLNEIPLNFDMSNRDWLVTGNLDELIFATAQSSNTTLPQYLDIEFLGLQISKLIRGRFQLHDLRLDGTFGGESSSLAVRAEEGSATLTRDLGQRWQLNVEQLRLWHSAFDTTNESPIDPTVFLQLPSIDVSVQELYMFAENGDAEEFGTWTFALDTTETEVHISDIVAELRGVTVDTLDYQGILWDTNKNVTQFSGEIRGTNLLQVLPEFDVEAEIESTDFTVYSELSWPGSPFDVNTLKMSGRIRGDANEGTLLEVEAGQGILRLLSVFNIAPIIQRMDFDPRAVFSKGFNFDRIMYDVTLDRSELIIEEPIHIKGRSSEILFSGNANLVDESLTMDVVVRIPFSNNLKWYVALATGNPTAFLGTMIGSRIFRRQLDRISSAKYKVGGTFKIPEVEFIGFFDDDLTQEQTDEINEE